MTTYEAYMFARNNAYGCFMRGLTVRQQWSDTQGQPPPAVRTVIAPLIEPFVSPTPLTLYWPSCPAARLWYNRCLIGCHCPPCFFPVSAPIVLRLPSHLPPTRGTRLSRAWGPGASGREAKQSTYHDNECLRRSTFDIAPYYTDRACIILKRTFWVWR